LSTVRSANSPGRSTIRTDLADDHLVVQPTFLATAMAWEHPGSNPLLAVDPNPARTLHLEQEYLFHGPPPETGTLLTCQMQVGEPWQQQGRRGGEMTFVSVTTEFRNAAGDVVAESIWTEASISRASTQPEDSESEDSR
jgi:hypothetical protein